MPEHENPVEVCISLGVHEINDDFMSYNCNNIKINGKDFEVSKHSTREQLILIPIIECSKEKPRKILFNYGDNNHYTYVGIIRHEILSPSKHLVSWENSGITKFSIIEDIKSWSYEN